MTQLIIDSTCDLPEDMIDKYDIRVLPLHLSLEGKEYRDKLDIQVDEVYAEMRRGVVPQTSQVSFSDCHNLFEECCAKGCGFIYLAFSSALSGTYQVAKQVLSELRQKYPENRMEVVDTKSGSVATGLIALQAAKMIQAEYEYDQIIEQISDMVGHVEHLFTINDLKWLIKGGRIDKLQGMIGALMNVKPLLSINNGAIEITKKVRGRDHALRALVDIVAERIGDFPNQIIGISHADDFEYAEALKKLIASKTEAGKFIICKIGGVLGSHLGIGGIGVFFFNKSPEFYFA